MSALIDSLANSLVEMSAREVRKKLRDAGCEEVRQSGSHVQVKCPSGKQTTVPVHGGKDIKKGTLHGMEKSLNMDLDGDGKPKGDKTESLLDRLAHDVLQESDDELPDLPEDMWRYFKKVPGVIIVPVSKLRTTRARPTGIANAAKYMRLAFDGKMEPRKPISLTKNDDGTYTVNDGNSTTANAIRAKWKMIPGVLEKPSDKHESYERSDRALVEEIIFMLEDDTAFKSLTAYAKRMYAQARTMSSGAADLADVLATAVGAQAARTGFTEEQIGKWLQSAYGEVWVKGGSLNPGMDLKDVRKTMMKSYERNRGSR